MGGRMGERREEGARENGMMGQGRHGWMDDEMKVPTSSRGGFIKICLLPTANTEMVISSSPDV